MPSNKKEVRLDKRVSSVRRYRWIFDSVKRTVEYRTDSSLGPHVTYATLPNFDDRVIRTGDVYDVNSTPCLWQMLPKGFDAYKGAVEH